MVEWNCSGFEAIWESVLGVEFMECWRGEGLLGCEGEVPDGGGRDRC